MWRKSRRASQNSTARKKKVSKKFTRAQTKLVRSKIAQKRFRVRLLIFGFILIIITSLLGALSWISFSPVLAIQKTEIIGNSEVRTRAIQHILFRNTQKPLIGLFSKQNTVLYPAAELERILLYEFPEIKGVTIDSQITKQQVRVTITEREPYAQWCRNSDELYTCYFIDNEGFIYEESPLADFLIFEKGIDETKSDVLRTFVEPKYFQDVKNFLATLKVLDVYATKFVFEGIDGRIYVEPGWEIRIALDKDLETTAVNLEAVLDEYLLRDKLSELRYIDMRFGERVYHTFKESTDTQEE
ncbi:hypothetical protein CL644_01650 [bacterium]|nr:hypothetical protein [Parcubacteria group bacterium]MBF05391.1 hypothetical protein [bacterium]|tara:strand:+ start:5094 stop:5993 length:900 start_codon:yes stop_codon:yes gene_type:complete